MRHTRPLRRGNCLPIALFALAAVGVIALAVGGWMFLTSDAATAVKDLQAKVESLQEGATVFAAPGSAVVELKKGGGTVMLAPDNMVDGENIPAPGPEVAFAITVKDAAGNPVKYEPNTQPRNPGAPFHMFGFFEVPEDGAYTVEVTLAGGEDPRAAMMVATGTEEDVEALTMAGLEVLKGTFGGCVGVCGLLAAIGFGIPALVLSRRKPTPDPLAG
jgi:hypothetical protein